MPQIWGRGRGMAIVPMNLCDGLPPVSEPRKGDPVACPTAQSSPYGLRHHESGPASRVESLMAGTDTASTDRNAATASRPCSAGCPDVLPAGIACRGAGTLTLHPKTRTPCRRCAAASAKPVLRAIVLRAIIETAHYPTSDRHDVAVPVLILDSRRTGLLSKPQGTGPIAVPGPCRERQCPGPYSLTSTLKVSDLALTTCRSERFHDAAGMKPDLRQKTMRASNQSMTQ